MNKTTRILLVDDHEFLRQGLRVFIEGQTGCQVVAEAASAEEALACLPTTPVDLVVMDLDLPGEDGMTAMVTIKARWPRTKVIILSGKTSRRDEPSEVQRALLAGADGFVSKQDGAEFFAPALHAIQRGKCYLSPEPTTELIATMRAQAAKAAQPGPVLSEREYSVLLRLGEGASYKDIAADLELSVKSVETFRTRGMKKLGLKTREELVRYTRQPGLPAPSSA
ncbi:MAG: response regulator transcription factor [Opitutae bacterium]|nr:response regulator transcription factor [Opitutae bacterium]